MRLMKVECSLAKVLVWQFFYLVVSLCLFYLSRQEKFFHICFGLGSLIILASLLFSITSRRTFFVSLTTDYIEWGQWKTTKVYWCDVKSVEWQSSETERLIFIKRDGTVSVLPSDWKLLRWPGNFMDTLQRYHRDAIQLNEADPGNRAKEL